MKQILAVFILLVVCLVEAPVDADPIFEMALKGGSNAATTTDESSLDLHNRYGFSGGVEGGLQWPLAEKLLLGGQVELLYFQRGTSMTFEDEDVAKTRLHYFDVTLAVRPEARLGPARAYLLLGGGLNLLMSATLKTAAGMERDITDDLHRVDVALLAGAGVALSLPRWELGPFRPSGVFLEARHDRGLLDTDAVNGGFKNRASSLMLGLSLALASPTTTAGSAK